MNELAIFAFVVMPIVVVLMGYGAMRLHFWDLDRRERAEMTEGKKPNA